MADAPPPSRLFPVIALLAMVAFGLLAWWGFPALQAFVNRQDCVATGRTNCG